MWSLVAVSLNKVGSRRHFNDDNTSFKMTVEEGPFSKLACVGVVTLCLLQE